MHRQMAHLVKKMRSLMEKGETNEKEERRMKDKTACVASDF